MEQNLENKVREAFDWRAYCDNCAWAESKEKVAKNMEYYEFKNDPCEECTRKRIGWLPSDELIKKIIKVAKEDS